MICSTCGRENAAHLTFCQECGQRLGPRVAPPTPPIGLGVDDSGAGYGAPARMSTSLGMTQVDPPREFPPVAPPVAAPVAPPAAAGGPAAQKKCRVCETINPGNLRYCTSCGSTLDPPLVPNNAAPNNAAVIGASAAPPVPAAAPPAPIAPIAPARVVDLGSPAQAAPQQRTCARCRGVVDPGAQFCKFCGASLGESGAHARAPNGSSFSPTPAPVQVAAAGPAPKPVAKAIAPPTPLAAFAPAGIGPMPISSPVAAAPYGPPPPMPVAPSAQPPPVPGAPPATALGGAAAVTSPPIAASPPAPAPPAAPPPAPPPVPAAKPAAPLPSTGPTRGRLVVIAKSGADGPSYPIGDMLDVGRAEGHVIVAEDPYLSPRHVRIAWVNGRLLLRDLGSTNGVFLRLCAARDMNGPRGATGEVAVPLHDQDLILVGQQVLRFDVLREAENGLGTASEHGTLLFGSPAAPRYARLAQRTVEGVTRDVYYLRKMETVLGRESGDVVFTEDPFLSRRHAAIRALGRDGVPYPAAGRPAAGEVKAFALVDLGSSNGSFLRIRNEVELVPGDQFRVGQQLFRVDVPGVGGSAS